MANLIKKKIIVLSRIEYTHVAVATFVEPPANDDGLLVCQSGKREFSIDRFSYKNDTVMTTQCPPGSVCGLLVFDDLETNSKQYRCAFGYG